MVAAIGKMNSFEIYWPVRRPASQGDYCWLNRQINACSLLRAHENAPGRGGN